MKNAIVVIGDIHAPFCDWKNVEAIISFIRKNKVSMVCQIGDAYDFFSLTRYPFRRDLITPKEEIESAREMMDEFWFMISKASTQSDKFQIKGNHDIRPYKRLTEKCPEVFSIVQNSLDDLFRFKNVQTIDDYREELIYKDIVFQHGFRGNLGDHARHNRQSTVCGHSHRGGVAMIRQGKGVIWELNAGYVGDEHSEPLSYTAQKKFATWTQGFGVIDELGPRFIPLPNRGAR